MITIQKIDPTVAQIALTLLHGIGPVKARTILSNIEDIEQLFKYSIRELENKTSISRNIFQKINREKALNEAKAYNKYNHKKGIKQHFYTDKTFPRRLKQCEDAPILLYSLGNVDLNPMKTAAVVGTRNATAYGKEICQELIEGIKGNNIQIVSGMAYGIDIHAHQLCVQYEIQTIGVLGHGLDRLYPAAHKKIAEKMKINGGLVTEYLPGTNPDRENFPMRNRIVAGMTDATIVIESKSKGGSLITAELANDYSRDVFAYPGNVGQVYSEGCNYLISKSSAHLLSSSNEFLKIMNWKNETKKNNIQRQLFIELSNSERKIINELEKGEQHIDTLAFHLNETISTLSLDLFNLEINGLIKSIPGSKYRLV
jgi:DNA processing protein